MTLVVPRPALALLGGVMAVACAHVEAPRGGPEDLTPPAILTIRPAPDTIVAELTGPAVITFDERISEQGVEEGVILSPRTSPVSISHGRSEIRVAPREGWAPGVIYQLTVLPEVRDLFGNRLEEPVTIVFSTGPEIPMTLLSGRVADRLTEEAEVDVRVEAIRQPDSLVYATRTDSIGAFEFARIPEGDYLVRAFEDLNRNRQLDGYERRDTLVTMAAAEQLVTGLELRLLAADSTPPVAGASSADGRVFAVEFDDYLDPAQDLTTVQVTVTGPDEVAVPVDRVAIGSLPVMTADPITQADTIPAPADTLLGPADTLQLPVDTLPLPADTLPLPTDTLPVPSDTLQAALDTIAVPMEPMGPGIPELPAGPIEPMEPATESRLPSRTLVIEVVEGAVLEPLAEYRIDVTGLRNVVGLEGGGTVTVIIPEPPVAEDTVAISERPVMENAVIPGHLLSSRAPARGLVQHPETRIIDIRRRFFAA